MSRKNVMGNGTNEIKALQANAGIHFTLLGRPFVAAFSKKETANDLDIAFVVMPEEGSVANSSSIKDLCDGLNGLVSGVTGESTSTFSAEEMNKQVEAYTKGQEKSNGELMVQLNQMFLYIRKKGSNDLDVQYALSLSLDTKDFGLEFGTIVSMDSVWISIWNTDFENIKETMQLEDIDELLGISQNV